jgi:hypothetical protein
MVFLKQFSIVGDCLDIYQIVSCFAFLAVQICLQQFMSAVWDRSGCSVVNTWDQSGTYLSE